MTKRCADGRRDGRADEGGCDGRVLAWGMPRVEEHIQELLKLPIEDRARVAKLLLDSLDEELDDVDAEALRVAELARRAGAVADGTAELIDAEEVRRRIAARLPEARTR